MATFLRPQRQDILQQLQQRLSFSLTYTRYLDYASRTPAPITLKSLLSNVDLLENAQFLHREIPIRLAQRINELNNLPYKLSETLPVSKIRYWYDKSFDSMLSIRCPKTYEDELAFTEVLEQMTVRHSKVLPTMAEAILQVDKSRADCPFLQDFLDRFYTSRIGLAFLIGHHCALHYPNYNSIGQICNDVDVESVSQNAIYDAYDACERAYNIAPSVKIFKNKEMKVAYVTSHLYQILFEILKNAMKATVKHNELGYDTELPIIEVIFADGDSDWAIKISDQGGGIKRQAMDRIWSYLYTSGTPPNIDNDFPITDAPLSGLGYGLPLCRLIARYFGGDIKVVSMDGYGTDVYIYLNKLQHINMFLD